MNRLKRLLLALVASSSSSVVASDQVPQIPLPGKSIPKYVEALPTFVGARVQAGTSYTVEMDEFQQKVLPDASYANLQSPFDAGTYVWGYKVNDSGPHYPGFTVESQVGTPVTVTYTNNLIQPNGDPPVLQKYITVDQTLHWADPNDLMCQRLTLEQQEVAGCFAPYTGPVPAVGHLHGGEVQSFFDGGPEEWFTPTGLRGPAYSSLPGAAQNQAIYTYPNGQQAATLWFHDHGLGVTRTNVYSGMAAFYLLRDAFDTGLANNPLHLPAGGQEIEIAIQDRMFDTNGQLLFPDGSPSGPNGPPPNPDVHPFWIPEFFGDVIVVNGKTWPFLDVEPRRYRFRLLDGSNARMYDLALVDGTAKHGLTIWQIGTDGGLLDTPVPIAYPDRLFMAPGERADVIVDFTGQEGKVFTLVNDAKAPFPKGTPPDPQTVGQIMRFRVGKTVTGADSTCSPAAGTCNLRPVSPSLPPQPGQPIVRLANPATGTLNVAYDVRRQLVLKEIEGPGGPLEVMLNNTHYEGLKESTLTTANPDPVSDSTKVGENYVTELPRQGSTELWEIINMTADAHPIHLHLVEFQLVNRQSFSASRYTKDWEAAFPGGFVPGNGPPLPYLTPNADGAVGGNIAVSPYLQGKSTPPKPNEAGWKDTFVMLPGQVTRVVVRYAPTTLAAGTTQQGVNYYSFDPTKGPGYVWHCHIVDHEDNEMMRPQVIQP